MDGEESDETRELHREQAKKERAEREAAEADPTTAGTATHDRRAAKAAYLRQKLEERAKTERESD